MQIAGHASEYVFIWDKLGERRMVEEQQLKSEGAPVERTPLASNRFFRYGPPIIWAALIFIGSSDLLSASHTGAFIVRPLHLLFPHASETTIDAIHFAVRKLGHFTEYAILAGLTARALRGSSRPRFRDRWFWISLLLVTLYSLSDEYHQTFIPSRTASIFDSLIDTVGGLAALLFMAARTRFRRRMTAPAAAAQPD